MLGDPIDIPRLERCSSDDVRCWNVFCGEDCLDKFDRPRLRPRCRACLWEGGWSLSSRRDIFAVACSRESTGLMAEVTIVPP